MLNDLILEITDAKKVEDCIPIYKRFITSQDTSGASELNAVIVIKWSKSALMRIKTKAWKELETGA